MILKLAAILHAQALRVREARAGLNRWVRPEVRVSSLSAPAVAVRLQAVPLSFPGSFPCVHTGFPGAAPVEVSVRERSLTADDGIFFRGVRLDIGGCFVRPVRLSWSGVPVRGEIGLCTAEVRNLGPDRIGWPRHTVRGLDLLALPTEVEVRRGDCVFRVSVPAAETDRIRGFPHLRRNVIDGCDEALLQRFLGQAEIQRGIPPSRSRAVAVFRRVPLEVIERARFNPQRGVFLFTAHARERKTTRIYDVAMIEDRSDSRVWLVPDMTRFESAHLSPARPEEPQGNTHE